MKRLFLCIVLTALCGLLFSCSDKGTLPSDPIIGLGGDDWVRTQLDDYLYQHFTMPYNIEVKYKWDPYEVNFNRSLVPPDEAKVIPVMETVRSVWMEPYELEAGPDFLKQFQILKYVLVGSGDYQSDGTMILGTAEGGNKVTLFVVNHFQQHNRAEVIRMMHTIHHEFAHILHQTIDYPQAWRGLSTPWYTATWYNSSDLQANSQGLITAYAKAAEREDFVETIAYLLVEGQEAYDRIVLANPDVAAIFRRKEELVVGYYGKLGIDFRELQARVREGVDRIVGDENE